MVNSYIPILQELCPYNFFSSCYLSCIALITRSAERTKGGERFSPLLENRNLKVLVSLKGILKKKKCVPRDHDYSTTFRITQCLCQAQREKRSKDKKTNKKNTSGSSQLVLTVFLLFYSNSTSYNRMSLKYMGYHWYSSSYLVPMQIFSYFYIV